MYLFPKTGYMLAILVVRIYLRVQYLSVNFTDFIAKTMKKYCAYLLSVEVLLSFLSGKDYCVCSFLFLPKLCTVHLIELRTWQTCSTGFSIAILHHYSSISWFTSRHQVFTVQICSNQCCTVSNRISIINGTNST